ncbi:hypothetical protein RhiirA4_485609 [Rhizophagus irregularis]|uniref:Uncharacterized protein n=1 Tax=Rhizophagus irregularis TaxID=588596 RepID=A0A2I1HQL9_9GLOM|nr:hypothetical protein RhiirA4_485609 [Rhizophagus irregularis]
MSLQNNKKKDKDNHKLRSHTQLRQSAASNLLEHGFMFGCMENFDEIQYLDTWKIWWSLNIWTCGNLLLQGPWTSDYNGSPTLWMREWCSLRRPVLGRVESWNFGGQPIFLDVWISVGRAGIFNPF